MVEQTLELSQSALVSGDPKQNEDPLFDLPSMHTWYPGEAQSFQSSDIYLCVGSYV